MPSFDPLPEQPLASRRRQGPFGRTMSSIGALFRMRIDKSVARIGLLTLTFGAVFLLIGGRLFLLGLNADGKTSGRSIVNEIAALRPDIVDRNGEVLATDVRTVSVFAEPRNIIDKDEATELLTAVLPDLDARELRDKLGTKKGFVWVKREITPRQQAEVHRLGIPGIGFLPEDKRVYPNGPAAAHILGFANVDNVGIAGMEKYIDNQGLADLLGAGFAKTATDLKPVQLSIDLHVQHAVRDELIQGMAKFKAKAAGGAIIDVNTGEIVALVSLPDFDPNNPVDALEPDRINRMLVGVYEMGSTFKALTTAMALDSGKVGINTTFDTRGGQIRFGKQVIHEYHGTNRALTVPEVFLHSSNIGSVKEALTVGVEGHKAFLKRMGVLDRMTTEMPESAAPIYPRRWGELNTATIAFGHGIAVAPMQAAVAVAALVNGGHLVKPTFIKQEPDKVVRGPQVIKPETSEALRFIMRLNAEKGSAKKADIQGYFAGGKTGTAEKVFGGRYVHNRLFTTFMSIMPADKPKYLYVGIYDEPQGLPETYGFATAAWNIGTTTGKIMERTAPMMGVPVKFEPPVNPFPTMVKLNAWGIR